MKRAPDIPRLDKEKVLLAKNLSNFEARCLVSDYYQAQEMRKRADMQLRHLGDKDKPFLLDYTADGFAIMESNVKRALQEYAESTLIGQWCMSQDGVGPVISAGLMAHIDIEKAQTAGSIWRFAGLDPTSKWKEGEKRPWNAALKQICWHLGQCFKRVRGAKPEAYYGLLYEEHKAMLESRNAAGYNQERAKTYYTKSNDVKKILKKGMLPPSNIDLQACRWTAKIFLSHLHAVWYWHHFDKVPPRPFAIEILGHAHEIKVCNGEMIPGFMRAYYGRGRKSRK